MKRIAFIIITVALTFTFSSCTKDIEDSELGYVGYWNSYSTYIEINSDGSGSYDDFSGFTTTTISDAKVKINNGNLIIRGVFPAHFVRKKFSIDTPPTYDSYGDIFMILDNEVFYKTEDFYYY